jgi:hypothetical protein
VLVTTNTPILLRFGHAGSALALKVRNIPAPGNALGSRVKIEIQAFSKESMAQS